MNKLIMITNYFPYGSDTGEMYLRNEIFTTCHMFDQVIVFACDAEAGDVVFSDNLPKNVQFFPLGACYSKLTCLLPNNYLKEDPEILKEREDNSLIKNAFLNYLLNKTEYRINKINGLGILKKNNDDRVVIYSYRLFDLAMIGIYIKENYYNNAIVVSRAHRYDLYEDRNKLRYLPCRKYLISHLDMIYPCSLDGERYLKSRYESYEQKVQCSYLGTNDYGISIKEKDDKFQIISCSNVIPVKRVEKIAEVVYELSKKVGIKWTHIGTGSELDGIKKKYNKEISAGIMLFCGKLEHDQVIKLYKQNYYDLFINLSDSEGIPQAIMEAMSFGIPTVATNVGGNSEIVRNDYSGYIVNEKESVQSIVNIIENHINKDIDSVNAMRRNSRSRWEDFFDAEKNAKRFVEDISDINILRVQK